MVEPQTRTVTFLLTDVEGSTAFWEQNAAAMRQALVRHDALLADGIAAHGGQILLSQAIADLLRDSQTDGLNVRPLGEHRFRDLARPESVFQVVHPTLPGESPPLRSLEAHPNNLPRELTSFVGREREVAEVRRLLSTTRLLTLTRSGGVGKTRLSQRVAADLGPGFPDGVWLVELAGLGDAALLAQTVASALGIREQAGRALQDTLVDVLRPQVALLLPDNCEHLIAACALLADGLLRACPGLTVLATSREPLALAGEAEHDNLRSALSWSLADAAPESARQAGQRLAGVLWSFWWMRTHLTEGTGWLEAARAVQEPADESGRHIRARVLIGSGMMAISTRADERAEVWGREAASLLRPGEDAALTGLAMAILGITAEIRGDPTSARAHYEESLEVVRVAGLTWMIGWQLGHLGRLALARGDEEQATALIEESLRALEAAEDVQGASWSYQYLARVMERQGDLDRAMDLFEQARAASRDVGDRIGMAWAIGNLGRLARARGQDARADRLLDECLRVARQIGDQWCAAWALGNQGRASLARSEHQRASALFEESLVLCRSLSNRERRSSFMVHYLGGGAWAHGIRRIRTGR